MLMLSISSRRTGLMRYACVLPSHLPVLSAIHNYSLPFPLPLPFPSLPSLHPLPTPPSPLPFLHSQMQAVDPDSALRMYANSKQWDKCLELAHKQVQILNSDLPDVQLWQSYTPYSSHQGNLYHRLTLQGGDILSKYVALYAAELIKSNAALSALKLFSKYGAPPNPQVATDA